MSEELVQWSNAAGAAWLGWAWRAALISTAAFALLAVLWPLLRRHLSSHAASWLWLLVLVPLAAPPVFVEGAPDPLPSLPHALTPPAGTRALASGGGAGSLVDQESRGVARDALERADTVGPTDGATSPREGSTSTSTSTATSTAPWSSTTPDASGAVIRSDATAARLHPAAWVAAAWLALALVGLLRLVRDARATARLVRSARIATDRQLRQRFDAAARRLGLDRRVELRITDALDVPATAGLFDATVLVPADLCAELDDDALDWVLRHELAHVRRRDVAVTALVRLVRAVWFFHPVVWLAPRAAERARELACDEAALAPARGADGPCAANALLHVLERRRDDAPIVAAGAVPLAHPRSLERQRIMKLLDPKLRASRGLSSAATAVIALLSSTLLASGVRALPAAPLEDPLEDPLADAPVASVDDSESRSAPDGVVDTAPFAPAPADDDLPDRGAVIASALEFLVANQHEDGHWAVSRESRAKGAGEFDTVGVTAQALLALVEGADDDGSTPHRAAIVRARDWLAARQDPETGAFTLESRTMLLIPSHARALEAWIAAHIALDLPEREPSWIETATSAVHFAALARNPYMGWRYDHPPTGDNDSVITGWMLRALADARDVGIEIDRDESRGGLDVIAEYTDPATGRIGYAAKGQPTSRLAVKHEDFSGDLVEFPTAVALEALFDWGADPIETEGVLTSAALIASKPPRWSRGRGTTDSYYWLAGTRVMQRFGGVMAARWNRALDEALLTHFDRDGEGRVFWEPVDAWHVEGQEVAMTATCVRALLAVRELDGNAGTDAHPSDN